MHVLLILFEFSLFSQYFTDKYNEVTVESYDTIVYNSTIKIRLNKMVSKNT